MSPDGSGRMEIMMNRKHIVMALLFAGCVMTLTGCKMEADDADDRDMFAKAMSAEVKPLENLEVSAVIGQGTEIALSWNDISRAVSYEISRSEDGEEGSFNMIGQAGAGTTSYVDETAGSGMNYCYKVTAACEYSQADQYVYRADEMVKTLEAQCSIFTGAGDAYWAKDAEGEDKIKMGSITLSYSFGEQGKKGMEPDGVEIFRKTTNESYKVIAQGSLSQLSTKSANAATTYVDTTVSQGTTYYYQVRAYALADGEKVYGKKSEPLKMTAAEPEGEYQLQLVREPSEYNQYMILHLTSSSAENGVLQIKASELQKKVTYEYKAVEAESVGEETTDEEKAGDETAEGKTEKSRKQKMKLSVTQTSSDGYNWNVLTETVVLNAGEDIYLRFEPVDATRELAPVQESEKALLTFEAKYNEGLHPFRLDLKKLTAVLWD